MENRHGPVTVGSHLHRTRHDDAHGHEPREAGGVVARRRDLLVGYPNDEGSDDGDSGQCCAKDEGSKQCGEYP